MPAVPAATWLTTPPPLKAKTTTKTKTKTAKIEAHPLNEERTFEYPTTQKPTGRQPLLGPDCSSWISASTGVAAPSS